LSQDEEFKVKKWKYLVLKESIDGAIEELKIWQDVFDPSWFLIMKAATPQIDAELESVDEHSSDRAALSAAQSLRVALRSDGTTNTTIFLPEDGLESIATCDIPFSSTELGERPTLGNSLILERITCPPDVDPAIHRKTIAALATKLSHSNLETFGLLRCKGVIKHARNQSHPLPTFTFVLRVPEGYSHPQSLRGCLLQRDTNHSLSDRFKLAKDLAKAIGYVRIFGFVHKNIRPETVLIFKSSVSTIGSVALVGFDNFRTEDGRTLHSGDTAWEKNLYRHPRRQGQNPEDDYMMQHDIYSLGVCLLELGLWDSFVGYDEGGAIALPSPSLGVPSESSDHRSMPVTKDNLVSLTRMLLPRRMGTNYAEIVETCLTCLDENNADFGDEHEFLDQDGIRVGVRYIEKVTLSLVNL
jgi:serine/threonine protein kinase